MTLALTIEGIDVLDNGQPARFELDRHGAMIGRSPHADWSLPDARNLVSSRHCEISYRDGGYLLTDHSTNGTYLNGTAERLHAPHVLADGDRLSIGHYSIVVSRAGAAATAAPPVAEADRWESFPAPPPAETDADGDGWADAPDPILTREAGWSSSVPEPAPARSAGTWDLPAPVARASSSWSSEPSAATAPTANDIWGRLSEESAIDWSRGDFASIPADEDWGTAAVAEAAVSANHPAEPEPEIVPPAAERSSNQPEQAAATGDAWSGFVAASGLAADRLNRSPREVTVAAGAVLRQLVGGLMLMIEARARAKAQLGVQATGLELDGNNPLKFIRSADRAMLQLLDEPQRGFMPAERAIEDAFQDLQAHQMATLGAIRGALEGALSRFSPGAIRDGMGAPKGLARWLPVLQRARQWDAYELGFEGVVRGADDAFMEVFAKEFRLHYDRHIGEMKQQARDRSG